MSPVTVMGWTLRPAQAGFLQAATRAYRLGINAAEAYRTWADLTPRDAHIRKETYLGVYKWVAAAEKYSANLKYLHKDAYPNADLMPTTLTEVGFDYSYTVRVGWQRDAEGDFVLDEQGNRQGVFVQVVSDLPLTVAEIEEDALAAVEEGGENYGEPVEDVVVTGALRKANPTRFGR